jgi:hypothetical protein
MYVYLVDNRISVEITNRVQRETRAYYDHKKIIISKLINRYNKM